jgi:hypothetical protein
MFSFALGVLSGVILAVAVPAVYRWGTRVWAKRSELRID